MMEKQLKRIYQMRQDMSGLDDLYFDVRLLTLDLKKRLPLPVVPPTEIKMAHFLEPGFEIATSLSF